MRVGEEEGKKKKSEIVLSRCVMLHNLSVKHKKEKDASPIGQSYTFEFLTYFSTNKPML